MSINIRNLYTSCNCNLTPTVVHWGAKNNLICYGSCNAVMIYDPELGGGKIISSLVSHTKRVNSVRWISGGNWTENELVSGSGDCDAIVWSLKDNNEYDAEILKGHSSNVSIVDGLYKNSERRNAIVVSVSMDCTVKIWGRSNFGDNFQMVQDINLGYSITVALRIFFNSEENSLIMACGVDNSQIHIYLDKDSDELGGFDRVLSLKGHEDWVRGLDFTLDEKGDILLASSSQDLYIRIWRFSKISHTENVPESEIFQIKNQTFKVTVDSILYGHEGWVYSVNWSPNALQLLSSSLDKTIILWELDSSSNLWLEKARLGEMGGNTLGFYGALFGSDSDTILAHSYHGAFHIWRKENRENVDNKEGDEWMPQVTVGGHFGEVVDLAWDPQGDFIITVGADQTTRIHAPWFKSEKSDNVTWHEIARPQIHGYDMSSIALISRFVFASSAEEKVIRTFQAPGNFIENFHRICKIDYDCKNQINSTPKGASVPSLGLSNKAVFEDSNEVKEKNNYQDESTFSATNLEEPPTEETLIQNTLWPEIQKLYGHGYEVYSIASSPDQKYLASSCRATTAEHASIIIWDCSKWKIIQKLYSHTLTVVQMAFSPNSQHLLSVSRDRRWSLFTKTTEIKEEGDVDGGVWKLAATCDKHTSIHTRIIWCCAWSHDSKYFATGSRDGKVVVWTENSSKEPANNTLGKYEAALACLEMEKKGDSVTAVAFSTEILSANFYLLAIGLESGIILLYKCNEADGWKFTLKIEQKNGHHLAVRKLQFRSKRRKTAPLNANSLQLASCSNDHSLKIHDVIFE